MHEDSATPADSLNMIRQTRLQVSQKSVAISVTNANGRVINVEGELEDELVMVKKRVAKLEGIPVQNQQIANIYNTCQHNVHCYGPA